MMASASSPSPSPSSANDTIDKDKDTSETISHSEENISMNCKVIGSGPGNQIMERLLDGDETREPGTKTHGGQQQDTHVHTTTEKQVAMDTDIHNTPTTASEAVLAHGDADGLAKDMQTVSLEDVVENSGQESLVAMLTAMGYPVGLCQLALVEANGNLAGAVEYLIASATSNPNIPKLDDLNGNTELPESLNQESMIPQSQKRNSTIPRGILKSSSHSSASTSSPQLTPASFSNAASAVSSFFRGTLAAASQAFQEERKKLSDFHFLNRSSDEDPRTRANASTLSNVYQSSPRPELTAPQQVLAETPSMTTDARKKKVRFNREQTTEESSSHGEPTEPIEYQDDEALDMENAADPIPSLPGDIKKTYLFLCKRKRVEPYQRLLQQLENASDCSSWLTVLSFRGFPMTYTFSLRAPIASLATSLSAVTTNSTHRKSSKVKTFATVIGMASPHLEKLDFEDCELDDETFLLFLSALKSRNEAASLTHLNIAKNRKLTHVSFSALSSYMKEISLAYLDMSGIPFDQQKGYIFGNAFASTAGSAKAKLETLKLNDCNLTAQVLDSIFLFIGNTNLKKLSLRHNRLNSNCASVIGQMLQSGRLSIVRLDIRDNEIKDGVRFIADALRKSCSCQQLLLAGNQIEPEGFVALAFSLRENNVLDLLDLSFNNLSSVLAAAAVKDMLTVNTKLTALSLVKTSLTPECAVALAESLAETKTLRYLDVSINVVGTAGLMALATSSNLNHSLVTLNVECEADKPEQQRLIAQINSVCDRNAMTLESQGVDVSRFVLNRRLGNASGALSSANLHQAQQSANLACSDETLGGPVSLNRVSERTRLDAIASDDVQSLILYNTQQELSKVSQDLETAVNNASLLASMISAVGSEGDLAHAMATDDAFAEIYQQCKAIHRRLMVYMETLSPSEEDLWGRLLSANDQVVRVLAEWDDRLGKGKGKATDDTTTVFANASLPVPEPDANTVLGEEEVAIKATSDECLAGSSSGLYARF